MKPNYEDERGKITDLLVTPEYSITHITFTEGAVRGNHYHKKTIQHDFILSGELICKTDKSEFVCHPEQDITHFPGTQHAYQAIKDSEILSICYGPRKGEDYSIDTYKLDIPLL